MWMVAREAPVQSNRFCLADVLKMSAQLFSLLLPPLPSLVSQRLHQTHQMQWCSCCNSSVQFLQSSSNAWEKGTMKGEGQLLHPCFFLFLQRINLFPPSPSSSWTLWITCFFLGRWAKEAGWERSIYSSPPVYVPFLADVLELCTNAGRRENSGRNENWGKWRPFANA